MAAADAGAPVVPVRHIGYGHHCAYVGYERSPEGLENGLIRFELDPATGGMRSLVDKTRGVELVAPDAASGFLRYAVEHLRGMTAWCINHTGPWSAPTVKQIRRTAKGPWKAGLEVDVVIAQSDFTIAWEVRAGDPKLYIGVNGVWFQRGTPQTGVPVLAASVPLALASPKTRYEIPFGAIARDFPPGIEVPALRWALVDGRAGKSGRTPAGCLLLNDSKHGHSFADGRLNLTLIRASHDPDILPEIGRHEIRLALQPCAAKLPTADAVQAARVFEHELKVVPTDAHDGDWPAAASLLELDASGVVLDTVKPAGDGRGIIVRLQETAGRDARGYVGVDVARLGRVVSAVAVDLLEREAEGETVQVSRNGATVTFRVPSFGICSLRLVFAGE
jgi:alpha-mannosidase